MSEKDKEDSVKREAEVKVSEIHSVAEDAADAAQVLFSYFHLDLLLTNDTEEIS